MDYDANINSISNDTDDIRESLLSDSQDLATFFKRPIFGTLTTWTPGTSTYGTFNPWNAYFTNKRVANRLSNFKLATARLHIKFMINGSPFHYGRFMISYIPLHTYDNCTIYPPSADQQLVWPVVASQRSKVFLDPAEGVGAELVLPFVWPYDALDLALGDFTNIGQLVYHDLNTLKHANAATSAIQITYAIWLEDVNMAVPTTVNISGLTTQSEMRPTIEIPSEIASPRAGRDVVVTCVCCGWPSRQCFRGKKQAGEEYSVDPVSGPASAVAQAANKLSSAPYIGKYARATSVGASAIAGIAKLFGYSKPIDLENPPRRMVPRYMSELANADGRDASSKLSLDTKQELTIDPSVTGYGGGDELDLAAIAKKESFITQFAWTTAKVAGNLLWNTRVNPFLGVTSTYRYSPACEFAAMPFTNWRGHMSFRIQIVCSRQHRGRLAVVWDPNYVVGLETNILHTTIIDLDETKDVVIKIPWGQRASYLTCQPNIPLQSNYGTVAISTVDNTYSNGVLAIYCMNELAVPNSIANNDIQVNVFACLCDAEFTAPNGYIAKTSFLNQSGEEYLSESKEEECAAEGTLVAPSVQTRHIDLIYFGERISSFRQLFKRFCLSYSDVFFKSGYSATKQNVIGLTVKPKFPPFRGTYSSANTQALHVTGATYENRVFNTFVSFVAPAFLCSRGGTRVKQIFKNAPMRKMSVMRNGAQSTPITIAFNYDESTVTAATNPTVSYLGTTEFTAQELTPMGTIATVVQPVVEVEFPYYYSRRFDTPRDIQSLTALGPTNLGVGSYEAGYRTLVEFTANSATAFGVLDTYCAAAEDFTCVWFQGCPPWNIYS